MRGLFDEIETIDGEPKPVEAQLKYPPGLVGFFVELRGRAFVLGDGTEIPLALNWAKIIDALLAERGAPLVSHEFFEGDPATRPTTKGGYHARRTLICRTVKRMRARLPYGIGRSLIESAGCGKRGEEIGHRLSGPPWVNRPGEPPLIA